MRQLQHRDGDKDDGQRLDQKLRDRDIGRGEHDEDQRHADAHDAQCGHRRHPAARVGRHQRAGGDEDEHRPMLEDEAVEFLRRVEDRRGRAHP
jgi:hypothetical protein